MKTTTLLTVLLIFFFLPFAQAQEEQPQEMKTLIKHGDKKITHGGYGAFSIGYTRVGDNDVLTLGGRAGWLIDHHITLGLMGNSFTSSIFMPDIANGKGYYMVGGYGGFFVEPIIAPMYPVHVSFPILIGAGGVAYNEYRWSDYPKYDYTYYEPFDTDAFFVLEPGVEVELNVVKFFRVALGASYRYTDKIDLIGTDGNVLRNFSGNVTFKFGKF